MVFTTAAASVSIALLLQFWKGWKVKFSCKSKHPSRMPDPRTWWIERENSFIKTIR